VSRFEIVVLIPESTRKRTGGAPDAPKEDAILGVLPPAVRKTLEILRDEIHKSASRSIDSGKFLPAYERFDGNMYRHIPREAWERRAPGVEVVIASALRGLVASRDPIPAYRLSMAETIPPFGKLNRWWHDRGLPEILGAYLRSVKPKLVVDLLSLEYRESVAGYTRDLQGIEGKPIDFPGMGRGSQPIRGEKIAEILRAGKA
jgi:hypothetical protein